MKKQTSSKKSIIDIINSIINYRVLVLFTMKSLKDSSNGKLLRVRPRLMKSVFPKYFQQTGKISSTHLASYRLWTPCLFESGEKKLTKFYEIVLFKPAKLKLPVHVAILIIEFDTKVYTRINSYYFIQIGLTAVCEYHSLRHVIRNNYNNEAVAHI